MIPGENPPTSAALVHILSAVYGHYWGRCLELSPVLPSPSDWGWKRWSSQIWETAATQLLGFCSCHPDKKKCSAAVQKHQGRVALQCTAL
ncbi:hypothetical protein OS493_039103, partial [Desmophyllum pertusum]